MSEQAQADGQAQAKTCTCGAGCGAGSGTGGGSAAACACMGVGPALTVAATEILKRLAPSPEVSQHFKAAHLEILKGIRALIDQQIAKQEQGAQPAQGTKISVE